MTRWYSQYREEDRCWKLCRKNTFLVKRECWCICNFGMYSSMYLMSCNPMLQIHQHSLLTRKVFFQHNFQHWSSSLYWLDHLVICISSLLSLQVIFIFKSSSSFESGSSLDHHGTSSLDLDHLSIWIIITRSGSSLDLDQHHWTGSGSSLDLDLDLDHLLIWIITAGSGSSLDLDHHSI